MKKDELLAFVHSVSDHNSVFALNVIANAFKKMPPSDLSREGMVKWIEETDLPNPSTDLDAALRQMRQHEQEVARARAQRPRSYLALDFEGKHIESGIVHFARVHRFSGHTFEIDNEVLAEAWRENDPTVLKDHFMDNADFDNEAEDTYDDYDTEESYFEYLSPPLDWKEQIETFFAENPQFAPQEFLDQMEEEA